MSEFPGIKATHFVNKTTEINYNSIVEIYEQSIKIRTTSSLQKHGC